MYIRVCCFKIGAAFFEKLTLVTLFFFLLLSSVWKNKNIQAFSNTSIVLNQKNIAELRRTRPAGGLMENLVDGKEM